MVKKKKKNRDIPKIKFLKTKNLIWLNIGVGKQENMKI